MATMRSVRYLSLLMLVLNVVALQAKIVRYHDEYQWDETNTRAKIEQKTTEILGSVWSWFDPETSNDIAAIKKLLFRDLLNDPNNSAYKVINSITIKLYSDIKIPQKIRAGILEYITNKSYHYAFANTGSSYNANKVKDRISADVMRILESKHDIPGFEPSLSDYIGCRLNAKIDAIINQNGWYRPANVDPVAPVFVVVQPSTPAAPTPAPRPAVTASSSEGICESGLDDPKTNKTCVRQIPTQGKVILRKCGHSPLCVSCAKQYIAHNVKACPKCGQQYDVNDLRNQVSILAQSV